MRILVKFTKTGETRYVSHLDLLRTMQRIIRRSNLPVKYSMGFNPHQIIAFAAASSVDVGSVGDWIDISMEKHMNEEEIINRLNEFSVGGIKFTQIHEVSEDYPPLMRIIAVADYSVDIYSSTPLSEEKIDEMIKRANDGEILAQKKSKKGLKTVDIADFIIKISKTSEYDVKNYDFPDEQDDLSFRMHCRLKHDQDGALNPHLLMPTLLELWDMPARYLAQRLDIWAKKDEKNVAIWSL